MARYPRIPLELAVVLTGLSATIGLAVATGCQQSTPGPVDATRIPSAQHDAHIGTDAGFVDASQLDAPPAPPTDASADAPSR